MKGVNHEHCMTKKSLSPDPPCLLLRMPLRTLLAVTGKRTSCQHHHLGQLAKSTPGPTTSPYPPGHFPCPQRDLPP